MKKIDQFVIEGGKPLNGSVVSSGAKNAALKLIAASVLTYKPVIIQNIPHIQDVFIMIELLSGMGAKVSWSGISSLKITCENLDLDKLDQVKIGHMRGSVVLIGPLVARFKKLKFHEPGGCLIGARPITTHIRALKSLGVNVTKQGKYYYFETDKLVGNRVLMDELSVTATETVLMAATLAEGKTEIHLAATEPEISNLIGLLKTMGAKISGVDTSILTIIGKDILNGGKVLVIPDRIEIGTFACAIAATKGYGEIEKVIPDHLDNLLNKFKQMGIHYEFKEDIIGNGESLNTLIINGKNNNFRPSNIEARPYPGFSTDMQSPMVALLTQAKGKSKLFETLFEGRLGYAKTLHSMGADIKFIDNRNIEINGPAKLRGMIIDSPDLRAGATFVIAGLIATGTTYVKKAYIIDRGYERFEEKLLSLGANIKRV